MSNYSITSLLIFLSITTWAQSSSFHDKSSTSFYSDTVKEYRSITPLEHIEFDNIIKGEDDWEKVQVIENDIPSDLLEAGKIIVVEISLSKNHPNFNQIDSLATIALKKKAATLQYNAVSTMKKSSKYSLNMHSGIEKPAVMTIKMIGIALNLGNE